MNSAPRTILITGATSGIGRHAAIYLARKGHHVLATGRSQSALDSLKSEGGDVKLDVFALDVTDRGSIEAGVQNALDLTGGRGIDSLVNNSGIAIPGAVYDISVELLRRQYEVNFFGLFAATKAFLPQLIASKRGRLVNVGSIAGHWSRPMSGAYNSSKHAVRALTESMRWELAPFGITTVLIEPGPVLTDIVNRTMNELEHLKPDQSPYRNIYAKRNQIVSTFKKVAVDTVHVSYAIEKAVALTNPSYRYVVPSWWRVNLFLYRFVPQSLLDFVFARLGGFNAENVRL